MSRYRSKVVEIDAWQFDAPGFTPQPQWLGAALIRGEITFHPTDEKSAAHYVINTLEGKMRASSGDWIIRGTEGELYPCKPSVFERKYEPA